MVTPSAKREAVALLTLGHGLSVRRACGVVRLARAAYYRPPQRRLREDPPIIAALEDVVEANRTWGIWKCFDRLRVLGHRWNHKRVHRIYRALRLNLPRRRRRRLPKRPQHPLGAPARLNHTWAVDFMTDTLYDGRRYRTLNVLDEGNREGLAIEVGMALPSRRAWRCSTSWSRCTAPRGPSGSTTAPS